MKTLLLVPFLLFFAAPLWAQSSQEQPPDTTYLKTQLAEATGPERIDLLVELASRYVRDDPVKAVAYGTEAMQQARAADDQPRLADALFQIGRAHFYQGTYEQAFGVFREAEDLYAALSDTSGLGEVMYQRGTVYWRMGNYENALTSYIRANQFFEATGNRLGLADVINDIGLVFADRDQFDEALSYSQQALTLYEALGNEGEVATAQNNIGVLYNELDEPEKALDYLFLSLAIKEKIGDRRGVGTRYGNIGISYEKLGDFNRAMDYLQRSIVILEEVRHTWGLTFTYQHIASVERQRGRHQEALAALDKALALATEINAQDQVREIYQDLSETYAALGRYREAFEAHRQFEQIKSTLFNEENSKTIAEMQARFEADQKQKEIELLEQQQQLDALTLGRQRLLLAGLLIGLILLGGLFVVRARIARRIQESEQRYRRLFDDPATARLLIDPATGAVLDANASSGPLLPGDAAPPLWLAGILARLNKPGEPERGAFVEAFRHSNGDERDFEAWVSRLQVSGREAELLTLHDVTERRRLEEARIRGEERERHIEEIEAKNIELERQNAELERYAYTVSHDLKNPLVTILSFTGMLRQDAARGDAERVENDLSRIETAADRMYRLLEDLLELSRIGRVVNASEAVSLNTLAEQAVAMLSGLIVARRVRVEVQASMPTAWGDQTRLQEVFQNLIENAIKFMGDEPMPRVEIGARQEGGAVLCWVRDNGTGIVPKYREKIFDLFERLGQQVEGTGVGLALVKQIVTFHGGRVWVESVGEGQGSTFFFTLPLQDASGRGE